MDTVENAKSTMHALEAEIQSANAAITVAKDDLNYTRLTAPITGRTGRVTFPRAITSPPPPVPW